METRALSEVVAIFVHMFDDASPQTTEGLEALVSALSRLGSESEDCPDAVRVDDLAVLERLKSAVTAAQARVTAAVVDSQEQAARAWWQRARARRASVRSSGLSESRLNRSGGWLFPRGMAGQGGLS